MLVDDVGLSFSGGNPFHFTNVGGTLYFSATDGSHGYELWRSDGTSSGTSMASDINPGSGNSTPAQLANFNDILFFTADDGVHGMEPWVLATGANHLTFEKSAGSLTAGSLLAVTVDVEDAIGDIDTDFSGTVNLALLSGPAGASLFGSSTAEAVNGQAVFSGLSLERAGSGYSLQATSGTLQGTSSQFTIDPGAATQLVISSPPPSAVQAGVPFALAATAEDFYGNVATSFSGDVGLSIGNNPSGGSLAGTLDILAQDGVAVFSNAKIDKPGVGYTVNVSANGLTDTTTPSFNVVGTLVIVGSNVGITFTSPTDFTVVSDGTSQSCSTLAYDKAIYAPAAGTSSVLVFDDELGGFGASQSLAATTINFPGFSLQAIGVTTLYVYGGPGCAATVDVSDGGKTSSNFFVDAADDGYSYIADPLTGQYSELSGFQSENIGGAGGTTYAYIYSTSAASVTSSPGQAQFGGGGTTATLHGFSQVYVVGAADGTDSVTINSSGGAFVASPSFSYATGTFDGSTFLIGALFCARVTAEAAGSSDSAYFYSYASDAFVGRAAASSFSGLGSNFRGEAMNVAVEADGYLNVAVFESGSGSDTATLYATDAAQLFETPTATSLKLGSSTITVDSFSLVDGTPVAAAITVNGDARQDDTATLEDGVGGSVLVAGGTTATLTSANSSSQGSPSSLTTIVVRNFGKIDAVQQNSSSDEVQQSPIDFALSLDGNWTSS